jgi:glycosyltransferase involved in cell wall biosynthesis
VASVSRRRILFVTPFAPSRDARHGGARVVRGLAGALAERHELVLVCPGTAGAIDADLSGRCVAVHAVRQAPLGRWTRRLRGAAGLVRGRPLWTTELASTALRDSVRAAARDFRPEIVHVENTVLGEAMTWVRGDLRRVITIQDPARARAASVPMRREGPAALHRLDAAAAIRHERKVLSLADGAVCYSEHDRRLLAPLTDVHLTTIPVGWDVPRLPLDPLGSTPPTLLFVGNFMHPPNIAAALQLARVWSRLRHVQPGLLLEIVGASPPPEVLALRDGGVNVTGEVASVEPYLDRAALFVAPITIGGGARVKLIEALAAGKAVVATTRALEGISVPREAVAVADTDDEMATAILRLIDDPQARRLLAKRARAWAVDELDWEVMADRYDELYEAVWRSAPHR